MCRLNPEKELPPANKRKRIEHLGKERNLKLITPEQLALPVIKQVIYFTSYISPGLKTFNNQTTLLF
jgi:hypothetical protein